LGARAQRPQTRPSAVALGKLAQQRRDRGGQRGFRGREVHAGRRVQQDFDARRDLFAVAADHQRAGARHRRPVEMAQIVAGDVGAVVVEFQAGAGTRAQAEALALPASARIGRQAQAANGGGDG
jgi:hypothetical protein